jgi:ParB family chromosome partitioning protein
MSNIPEININQNKKRALGRGLGSLFGESIQEAKKEHTGGFISPEKLPDALPPVKHEQKGPEVKLEKAALHDQQRIWTVAIEKVNPNPNQPRKDFDSGPLQELSDSIKEKGILQPITVRRKEDASFEIIAGERRWRAAQKAGLHEVPVIIRTSDDQDSFELAIIENIQRADLNAVEEAEAYDQLMQKYSLTQQQISQKVGKERATIANSLRLLALPPAIKQMLRQNSISTGHAKVILSLEDSQQQTSIAKVVISEKLSVRATEKLVSQSKFRNQHPQSISSDQMAKFDISKKLAQGVSEDLQKLLGTKVGVDYAEGKGKISISFYSDEQFNSQIEKIREAWMK